MSDVILITGANRGIGLALTREALRKGHTVFAACRKPKEADDLDALKDEHAAALVIVGLDVTTDASVARAVKSVAAKTKQLDVLINNAAFGPPSYFARLDELPLEHMGEAFDVNVVGPLRVARAFLPLLLKSKRPRILNISSGAGSLNSKHGREGYAYCTSKAALNMATRTLAYDLREEGPIVVALDPGWNRTRMGGPSAPLDPADSAREIIRAAEKLTPKQTSLFLDRSGKVSPAGW